LGYISEVDEQELETYQDEYVLGDSIGKAGLEKTWEKDLRGKPGSELLEVNARGELMREVGRVYAEAGVDMQLTLDMKLQEVLYQALGDRKGAVVAQNPQTGEVLAMVSSPAFDPNNIGADLARQDMPFFNRATGGLYPPGSIFKIVTATAGLEEGVINEETELEDNGEIRIGEYRYGNWYYDDYGRTEGLVNVVKALRRSNDIFFYKVGELVGAEKLSDYARLFGFESNVGLEYLGAVSGTIPNPEWKEKTKGERWFLGNTYHMAIGQGDVLITPLQANRMTGAIAARGLLCPAVLRTQEVGQESCTQLNLDEKTIELVTEGMKQACEPGGTAFPFFNYQPKVACKTGTAQQGGSDHKPHAWFTAFAPIEDPQIVISVLLEESGQGSEMAAPIAKEGLEYFFQGDEQIDRKAVGLEEEIKVLESELE
jgi:penicillin-binding protein 2